MVGLGRLELPTSRLSGVRSSQLSYRPEARKYCEPIPKEPTDRRQSACLGVPKGLFHKKGYEDGDR